MSKKNFRTHRHPFRFQIPGQGQCITSWAKVRNAKKPVTLSLRAEDVERAILLKGVGNTQTCTMAVCAKRQSSAFPHAVEGYIDWLYRTAFVVSKVSKETGLPTECFVYEHKDTIAQLNDTKGGQEKLLELLKKHGDRQIRMFPPTENRDRSGETVPGAGKKNRGLRKAPSLKGANLRFAVAQLGGVGQ